jgi:hypothetical protein
MAYCTLHSALNAGPVFLSVFNSSFCSFLTSCFRLLYRRYHVHSEKDEKKKQRADDSLRAVLAWLTAAKCRCVDRTPHHATLTYSLTRSLTHSRMLTHTCISPRGECNSTNTIAAAARWRFECTAAATFSSTTQYPQQHGGVLSAQQQQHSAPR